MVSADADLTPGQAAAYHDGLSHPVRVAAMRILRDERVMPINELRKRIGLAIDSRTMQFHARKMEEAGLLDVRKNGDVALLRDVSLRFKLVPGA